MTRPTCKVHGMIRRGAMCGHVIVGLKYCGFGGDCPHKSCADMIIEKVQADAAAQADSAQHAQNAELKRPSADKKSVDRGA